MFKIPLLQRSKIVSDEGFSVTVLSRYAVRYEQDGRSMLVSIEEGDGHIDIFHSSIKWEDDPGEAIDAATDQRITENLAKALEWRGWSVGVVT